MTSLYYLAGNVQGSFLRRTRLCIGGRHIGNRLWQSHLAAALPLLGLIGGEMLIRLCRSSSPWKQAGLACLAAEWRSVLPGDYKPSSSVSQSPSSAAAIERLERCEERGGSLSRLFFHAKKKLSALRQAWRTQSSASSSTSLTSSARASSASVGASCS